MFLQNRSPLSSSLLLLLIIGINTTVTTRMVNAERMVRFIFNDGMEPDETTFCTAQDNELIDVIFDTVYDRRTLSLLSSSNDGSKRQLRRGGRSKGSSRSDADHVHIKEITFFNDTNLLMMRENETEDSIDDDHRKLYNYYCRDNCLGFVPGTCRATRCTTSTKGRKLLVDSSSSTEQPTEQRDLQEYTCRTQVTAMNAQLNNLITNNLISDSCKAYLTIDSREVSCYDNIIYGEIYGMRAWKKNVTTDEFSILHSFMPSRGFTMCKSVDFTFEVLNNPCVETVGLRIDGPNRYLYNRLELDSPYTLFGDDGNGTFTEGILPYTGNYTVTIIPDNFPAKRRVLQFWVADC